MFKNVSGQIVDVFAFDYSTGAPKTGDAANITVYLSKDDGSLTALTDTSATEISSSNAPGWYRFNVSQSESNADKLLFTGKSSTSNVTVVCGPARYTRPRYFGDSVIDSSGRYDISKIAGTAQTARDIGSSVLLSSGTGTGQLDFTSGVVKSNVTQNAGSAITASGGRQEVNATHFGGSAGTFSGGMPLVIPQREGRTYYVAASGGNDSNSGLSRSAPFATASAAHTACNPGDTIRLMAGSYADNGTDPFVTISKNNITIEGDSQTGTVITNTAFDSGIWVTGMGCTVRKLKIVGTNTAGDIGIKAAGNWTTVEDCDLSTIEVGLLINGDYCTARRVKSSGGRYGMAMQGDNFLVDQCSGITNCSFAVTGIGGSTSNFAGMYVGSGKTGRIRGGMAAAICISATSSGKLIGLSLSASPTIVEGLYINVGNFSSNLTGGTYGVTNLNGAASVGTFIGGTIAATSTSGTAKEIDGSVSGSNITLYGTFTTPANWTGQSNIHRSLEPTDSRYTLDVTPDGEAGIDLGNVGSPTTTLNLSGITIKNATDIATTLADGTTGLAAIKTAASEAATNAEAAADAAGNAESEATAAKVAAQSADGKLDQFTFTGDLVNAAASVELTEENIDDIAEGVADAIGSATDSNHEPVPDSRKVKLVATSDRGLVGESAISLMVGYETTISVDFSADLAANCFVKRVEDVVLLADSGMEISKWGRDHEEAKFRVVATTPGSYDIDVRVSYNTGAGSQGRININVPVPQTEFTGGVPGSSDEIVLTDIDQEPIPADRVFLLIPTRNRGLVCEDTKSIFVGAPATRYAADFRNDCAANGRVATVVSVQVVEGDSGGLDIDGTFGRNGTRGIFTIEATTAGDYTLNIAVVYASGEGARGQIQFKAIN